jgi:hypothetical protein
MTLPTVLMTDVIRSSVQGNAHGGAYLINLETGSFDKVLDWNRVDIDWEGRGMGRGLRGITFRAGEVWIAASDELFVFDKSFNILRSYKCPALHHCHEISQDDAGRIWVTSTSYDALLRFDPVAQRYDLGWHLTKVNRIEGGRPIQVIQATRFDPNRADALPPKPTDSTSIRSGGHPRACSSAASVSRLSAGSTPTPDLSVRLRSSPR